MKIKEIIGKEREKAAGELDLLASIEKGVFTKDGKSLKIKHNLHISKRKLISLEWCPHTVGGDFYCFGNKLTALNGCPQKIGGSLYCDDNQLTSLVGSPRKIPGNFYCYSNNLTSLDGCPHEVGNNFNCSYNNLASLDECPKEVGADFLCNNNNITSLRDIHKHLKKMNGKFVALDNPISSHILGLLKIPGCKRVKLDNKTVEKIMDRYLPLGDLIDCQEELIEAGFAEYAYL